MRKDVNISFKNKKLQGIFESDAAIKKAFGKVNARYIQRRMTFLRAAPSLSHVPHQRPERCHQFEGRGKEQFVVDVKQPFRLVFKPAHNPLPRSNDGGIDLEQITAIEILAVEDYH